METKGIEKVLPEPGNYFKKYLNVHFANTIVSGEIGGYDPTMITIKKIISNEFRCKTKLEPIAKVDGLGDWKPKFNKRFNIITLNEDNEGLILQFWLRKTVTGVYVIDNVTVIVAETEKLFEK